MCSGKTNEFVSSGLLVSSSLLVSSGLLFTSGLLVSPGLLFTSGQLVSPGLSQFVSSSQFIAERRKARQDTQGHKDTR